VTERRRALVELARRYGFLVVEDVAYREISFDGERRPSLWALGPDCVLQIGTFSKLFMPGVRLGWAAGPSRVIEKLVWGKQNTDQGAGALGQRLLNEYGRRGLLDEQVAASCRLYRARSERMQLELAERMPETVRWTRPRGGFFTWLTLPDDVDAGQLSRRARQAKVAFVPGSVFYPDGRGSHELRLSFSRVAEGAIPEGIGRLARLLTPS
jgi:2-aminoadipate transaminase